MKIMICLLFAMFLIACESPKNGEPEIMLTPWAKQVQHLRN